jgi:hypothetical protein
MKNEMMMLEHSEFHFLDDVLADLKLTPSDIEMPIPKFFIRENSRTLKEREKMLGTILAKMGPQDDKKMDKDEPVMTMEEAIQLIQVHERARQGQLRAKLMTNIRQEEERQRLAQQQGKPTIDLDTAATVIQKVWKGYSQRKKTARLRAEELIFVGMVPPPGPISLKNTPQAVSKKVMLSRRIAQEQNENDYQQALGIVKARLKEVEGPDMREHMQDEIRKWFIEVRKRLC